MKDLAHFVILIALLLSIAFMSCLLTLIFDRRSVANSCQIHQSVFADGGMYECHKLNKE